MKKKVLLLFLVVAIFALIGVPNITKTYSRYNKNVNVNVSTTSAKMICDATIDNPGTYISNDGWAYFKVIVKNYDTSGNITQVPIQYNLTVSTPKFVSTVKVKVILSPEDTKVGEIAVTLDVDSSFVTIILASCLTPSI